MKADYTAERAAYNVLKGVFLDGAYSSIELERVLLAVPDSARGRVTALVYGVLEKSITLDYYIEKLVDKKPKNSIVVLLKLAIYELIIGQHQDYAIIDKYVGFAKDRFHGAHGFINAVLRKVKSISLPTGDSVGELSIINSVPLWAAKRISRDYPDRYNAILSAKADKRTHIRRNSSAVSQEKFDSIISKYDAEKTGFGYYVRRNTLQNLPDNLYTAQSIASMRAVQVYIDGLNGNVSILDLCAAPGGKSIYISELLLDADITACDIHKHRVELIKSYAKRMNSKIHILQNDATVCNNEWIGKFDLVVCDVPCSGSGLLKSSPDILLQKSDDNIEELTTLQASILSTAAQYVKSGGVLAYSTCSLFNAENEAIADTFSQANKEFISNGYAKFSPDTDGIDGFFITRWKKQ